MVLNLLLIALSGIATALRFLLGSELSLWWILPLWLGLYVALALIYLVPVLIIGMLLPKRDPKPAENRLYRRVVVHTLEWLLGLLGMRFDIEGEERLPHEPFLLVANHRSAFDPLAMLTQFRRHHLRFIAKPGVFRIPVIGIIMHRLCFLPIDRENARNAVTTIKRAAELIRDTGMCMGIFPEGTRTKDGKLLPFHAGSFKIAKLADSPVAVATIQYEKAPILPWGKRVHIRIVDVMEQEFVAENNTAALAERAETVIRRELGI